MPQIDPEQLAALRRLKAAFGDVEILEIVDHTPVALTAQGWLFDEEGDDDEDRSDALAH